MNKSMEETRKTIQKKLNHDEILKRVQLAMLRQNTVTYTNNKCVQHSRREEITPEATQILPMGQSNVNAYILMDDPLNLIQDIGLGLIPQADGIKHYVDYDSKYFSHDINAVVEAMKHYFY